MACKELRTPTEKRTEIPLKGKGKDIPVHHEINYANDMNKSLIGLAIKYKQLKNSELHYTLDFDNIVAAAEKQDSKKSYKDSNSVSSHGNKMKGIKKGEDKGIAGCPLRQFEDRRRMFFRSSLEG